METPNTRAGYVTEKVMAAIRTRLPNMPTHQYNPIYSAVLATLEAEFNSPNQPAFLPPDIAREVLGH